jgi:dTDP-4-amino-4,6-dideoxygalactose transaminase
LHLQKAYAGFGVDRGKLPVTESTASRILSLPMFPTLSEAQQQRVVEVVTGRLTQIPATDTATTCA